MKSRLILFISILCISFPHMNIAQGLMRADSLDLVLSKIRNPKEKVDVLLEFLKKPKNQYLEDSIGNEAPRRKQRGILEQNS